MREYGSEFHNLEISNGYFDNLSKYGECIYLRSGREALAFAAYTCNVKNKVIMMPAYCCWSMLIPFQRYGWDVVYYKLNDNLDPDLNYFKELFISTNPAMVLTMNYFGISDTFSTIELIKNINPNCICIEDFSHCTFTFDKYYNPLVDIYISSIRKMLGVCDGAVMISKIKADCDILQDDIAFSDLRLQAQELKFRYLYSKKILYKEKYKDILSLCEKILDDFKALHKISNKGLEMLQNVDVERVIYARKENSKHLIGILEQSPNISFLKGLIENIHKITFSIPIIVNDRNRIQKELSDYGVYAPILWPINNESRSICEISSYLSDHMLSIPIDQRYNYDDIEDIGNIIKKIVNQ